MRFKTFQCRFTQGELSPLMLGRSDVDQYYGGAETLTNVLPLPEGGVTRRYGLEYVATALKQLTLKTPSSATAPNGGTASNGYDDNTSNVVLTTNSVSTTNPYVVLRYDLGSSINIGVIYLYALNLTVSSTSSEFYVQGSANDTDWTTIGSALSLTTTAKNFSVRVQASYRYIRLARIGSTDLSTNKVTLGDMLVYEQGSESETLLIPYVYNTSNSYILLLSDKNIAVYQNGVLIRDVRSTNYTSARLAAVDWVQNGADLLLFHEDVQTSVFKYTGSDWTLTSVTYASIPAYGFGDGSGSDEVQQVVITSGSAGSAFTLTLDGETTAGIIISGTAATMASNIQTALRALSNTSATGITVAAIDANNHTVTFGGTDGKKPWPVMTFTSNSASNTGSVKRITQGGDSIWQASRGWPRHGAFYQGRLWVDGGKSLPTVAYGSVVSSPYSFFMGEGLNDQAIGPLTFEGHNTVESIHAGNALFIFTSNAEWTIPQTFGEPITPTTAAVRRQSKIGSFADIMPQGMEGGVYYLQKGGRALREFVADEVQQLFSNGIISLLSSHLIEDPVDMAIRETSGDDQNSYVMIVLSDGTLTMAGILSTQKIASFVSQTTTGNFKNCANDVGDMYFVVQRTINSATVRYLERFNPLHYMDASTRVTTGLPATTFTGLSHLEAASCRVLGDGVVQANKTPSSGSVTIATQVSTSMEIGLDFNPTIKDLPVQHPQESTIGNLKNVSEINFRLYNTTHMVVQGKSLSFSSTPFTGIKRTKGWKGWTDTGQVTITQTDPYPMTILAMEKRVNV